MAMKTDAFDSNEKETVLAKVLTEASRTPSLYVRIPEIGKDRRTDSGAKDVSTNTVDFEGDVFDYERNDFVKLIFKPKRYDDNHVLIRVEKSGFVEPRNSDVPKIGETDIPKICPICGKEGSAVVTTEYSSDIGGVISETVDYCRVDPENRGKWYEFRKERSYIH